ncbi:hypothetical protein AgCh_028960 [Apium graveolens]
MSHNGDGSSYKEDSSKEKFGHDYGWHEPYVSVEIVRPTLENGGQPLVLISNAYLMKQIYRMGDALGKGPMVERGNTTPHDLARVPLNSVRDQERHRGHERDPPRNMAGRCDRGYGSDRKRRLVDMIDGFQTIASARLKGVHPLHLEYFTFSGRVIAMALMHKVQVEIVFDRIFFMQLEGMNVSLEDIKDADPYLCRKILEMDPETVDHMLLV